MLNRSSLFLVSRLKENIIDAIRNTLIVLLPLLIFYHSHKQIAIGMAVGSLLISLTDLPGNRRNKALTALQSIIIFLLISYIFSLELVSPIGTGLLLICFTFLLSMLAALGMRSATVGSMGIVLMVFVLGLRPASPFTFSAYVLGGCVWFYLVSLIQVFVSPFRSLRHALSVTLEVTAKFLKAKSSFYDLNTPLAESYQQIIALHLRVSEKQELVRQLLLGDRAAMRKPRQQIRKHLNTAIRVIGLYEQVTAMHYDYTVVRQRLESTGALTRISELINFLSEETSRLSKGKLSGNFERYKVLIIELAEIEAMLPIEDAAVIKGILKNLDAIQQLLEDIRFAKDDASLNMDFTGFLLSNGNYWQKIKTQFHYQSPVLRFSLRLTALLGTAYLLTLFLVKDSYSYWLLLTVVIVARPRFALTWQRNFERMAGTVAGVILASLFIFLIKPTVILLIIASLALLGFFIWNRPKYIWSVCNITICVVISLSLYHGHPMTIISARILYSLSGCALAFAGIFVFPIWVKSELDGLANSVVEANRTFLEAVVKGAERRQIWLARKNAHIKLAKFSEGVRHAWAEPGKIDLKRLQQIQVVNYRINAVVISMFLSGRKFNSTSAQEIIDYLNIELTSVLQIKEITDHPGTESQLLKGQQLLEALAKELTIIMEKKELTV